MSKAKEWLSYPMAVQEFAKKYVDLQEATSIFWHCVEEGFIQTRVWNGEMRKSKIPPFLSNKIGADCTMNSKIWSDLNKKSRQTVYDESKFNFWDEWDDRESFTFEGIEFNRSHIIKLFSRKGVGGGTFQHDDWMRLTITMFELTLNDELKKFKSKSELQNALYHSVNHAAGDDVLQSATISPAVQKLWDTYQIYLQKVS